MRRAAKSKGSDPVKKSTKGSSTDKDQQHGYHPTIAIVSCYSGTFCVYLLANLLPNLPELQYPWLKSLLPSDRDHPIEIGNFLTVQNILALMFTFHFARRALETAIIHSYVRTNSLFELVGAHIYYWVFAFWMGWATREDLGFTPPPMSYLVIGIILFWIGEIGNCTVHLQLRDLRLKGKMTKTSAPTGRVIPRGLLFSLVSCPHYCFEIVTWIGFALSSMVLASFGLLSATVVVLLGMSMMHHQRYLKEFDGKAGRELYPPNRKALIPFIY